MSHPSARVAVVTVRCSGHARRRMAQRGITATEIEEAAADPSRTTFPSAELPQERLVILGETRAGRRLKLVVLADDNEFVITVADRDSEG